ncbi:MAG: RIP metalloprotease RseP [Deltaproteobacteria bacterium]|nr:RIP metalloprotease RseP [Deltaproteobacteria bacterium]
MSIIYFIIALGILVLVHEFGHFIMARRARIRVEAFSIGFGPKLFGFRSGGTEFKICLLPLGGFVKMLGEDPEDERAHDPEAFTAKPVPARAGVVVAGPLMNFLLASLLMPAIFLIGREEPVFLGKPPIVEQVCPLSPAAGAGLLPGDRIAALNGRSVDSWEAVMDEILLRGRGSLQLTVERGGSSRVIGLAVDPGGLRAPMMGIEPPLFAGTRIGKVAEGSPAAAAGLQAGDRVVAVGGTTLNGCWQGMTELVALSGGEPVNVEVERAGAMLAMTLAPEFNEKWHRYLIGIEKDLDEGVLSTAFRRHGPMQSIVRGEKELYRLTVLTFRFLKQLFIAPAMHFRSLGGPVQIAQASIAAAKSGLTPFLYFAAFLSLQLAILNLLPIPVLDGGHLLFLLIEAIRRRPLSAKARVLAHQAGLVFLLAVLVLVTFNDLDNLLGLRRLIERLF